MWRPVAMKSDRLDMRMTPTEKSAFQEAADLAGLALSSWVRERLRTAARRELTAAGKEVSFLQDAKGARAKRAGDA
jgi:uncharacterized protein (DUF1778 family)